MIIDETKKRTLVETAQKLYRDNFDARREYDKFAEEVDINTFKEACEDMSCLVHYLADRMYNVPEAENKIYHCIFKYNGIELSHYFNMICGTIVDSTIMQFGKLTPYENHDECYTNLEEHEYYDFSIRNEIERFEKMVDEENYILND